MSITSNGGDAKESTPLLHQQKSETPPEDHVQKPKFSVLQARIFSAFVPMFSLSAGSCRDSMLPQYLVHRLAIDAGYTNSTTLNPCLENTSDASVSMANKMQAEASEQLMYYNLVMQIPAFFSCLVIGSYSDYLGRRPMILVPVFTNLVKMILINCIIKLHLDLRFMYLAFGIDGLAGSWYAMLIALYSLTADISFSKKDRSFWIYFVASVQNIMSSAANVAVGQIVDHFGFFQATLLMSSMMAVAFIGPLLFLPETLHQRKSLRGTTPLTHLRKIFGFYVLDGTARKRVTFCLCLLIFVVAAFNALNLDAMDALYQMHSPFCWPSSLIGEYSALRMAGGYFVGALWFKMFQKCLSIEAIAMIGLLFQGGAFLLEAFIWETWQFYLVPVILMPNSPCISIIRTMFSILAGPENQGAVFSSVAVVETLCGLATSQIYNRLYAATVSFMPGAIYLVMAGTSLLTDILFGVYFKMREPSQQEVMVKAEIDVGKENVQADGARG